MRFGLCQGGLCISADTGAEEAQLMLVAELLYSMAHLDIQRPTAMVPLKEIVVPIISRTSDGPFPFNLERAMRKGVE